MIGESRLSLPGLPVYLIRRMFLRRIASIPLWILLYLPWLALLGWLAGVSWFLTDDAFISFRYVRNLVEGHGLVFNVGERVEGYSNFLWVLELAAIWKVLGVAPEHSAPWLSVAYTVGTVGALLWWMFRLPALPHRGLVGWLALGLVCSSATFAVWTSGGGLETRQFTFFIVLAVVFLSLYRGNRWGLLTASLSLAAAAYTRPEGPLIALCCFGWFLFQRLADSGRLQPDWRELRRLDWPGLAWLILPFVILVAGHFLFRYAYYGEWLPNTYYAKHVRPWYESGFRYLWAAALETGLYLLLPLAWVGLARRWRERRDGIYALVLLLIAAHLAYVMRIGGDHFEWRPLDFYWPLLALPAAVGIVHLGAGLAAWLRQFTFHPRVWLPGARTCALILFVPVIFYASAMQVVLLFEGARIHGHVLKTRVYLNWENAGWLLAAPGMSALAAISNDLRQSIVRQAVGLRFVEHREYAAGRIWAWRPYENMERGIIPEDAVSTAGTIGINYYYLPEPAVIDQYGLTDATVARLENTTPNAQRAMAHDRWAPPEYLAERGVNFGAYPAAATEQQALEQAAYAVPVGPDLWLPFDSNDLDWVSASFAGHDLRAKVDPMLLGDSIVRRVGDHRPIIRAEWEVYLIENRLIYVREACTRADRVARFFLAVYPVDAADLPATRKQHGFDNLDFHFDRRGVFDGRAVIFDGKCLVQVQLPEYGISEISTGQYVPAEHGFNHLWERTFSWKEGK